MKNYIIFLCSSIIEFASERKELNVYIRMLNKKISQKYNTTIYLHKCENMDNALTLEGMQKTYNEEICRSDLVVFLFGEGAGEYTLEELTCAAEHFGDKRTDKICVLCKNNPYSAYEDSSLKKLADKLSQYHIPHIKFSNIDGIKLAIVEKLLESGLVTKN